MKRIENFNKKLLSYKLKLIKSQILKTKKKKQNNKIIIN